MEDLNLDLYHDLRAKTLANNLTWLASFGCQIVRQADVIQVRHPDLPSYNANIVVGLEPHTAKHLEWVLANDDTTSTVYVDEAFVSELSSVLSRFHLQPKTGSRVKLVQLSARGAPRDITMRRAAAEEVGHWSTLYSKGFCTNTETVDRKRWTRSFHHAAISHWFLMTEAREIGVLQTCTANEVVGIYSVTILPGHRNLRTMIGAARALRAELAQPHPRPIYFERVKHRVLAPRASLVMFRKSVTLRRFVVYES